MLKVPQIKFITMLAPFLYLQLLEQLSQWIKPQDKRHLQGFAEIVAAILQSQSACLSHWLPYLSHRDCQARSHLERLSYFVHNPKITAETFYAPLIKHFLSVWSGEALELTLDTSMLWDKFCLVEVCLIWGGRSIPLAQKVLEHGSATVGFEQYRPVLETVAAVLPDNCTVTLLADRGFEHGSLMRWLRQRGWSWCIRAKSDLQVTLATGKQESVAQLLPEPGQANLFHHVRILEDISCLWQRLTCRPPMNLGRYSPILPPPYRPLLVMVGVLVASNPISRIISLLALS
jgi:hypothetical protein